jgi:hypothetical protein
MKCTEQGSLAPANNPIYIAVRSAAEKAGVLRPFRFLMMLLSAPANLMWLVLTLRMLHVRLNRAESAWGTELFPGSNDVIAWFLTHYKVLEKQIGFTFDREPRKRVHCGVTQHVHPMTGYGLT